MASMRDRTGDSVAFVVFALAIAVVLGRIADVGYDGRTPFLSANDRSRWTHVASMVDLGTHGIDRLQAVRDPVYTNRRPWATIDSVMHRDASGEMRRFSSKPPLMAFGVASVYRAIRGVTGYRMVNHPGIAARVTLMVFNGVLLAMMFGAIWYVVRLTPLSAGMSAATAAGIGFGTLLTPMAVSLNNHLVAAACIAVASAVVVAGYRYRARGDRLPLGVWAIGGLAAGLTAAHELPALTMTLSFVAIAILVDVRGAIAGVGGVGIAAALFFGSTFWVHGSLRPPYAHRGDGDLVAAFDIGDEWMADGDPRPAVTLSDVKAAAVDSALRSRLAERAVAALSLEEVPATQSGGRGGDASWIVSGDADRLHLVIGKQDFSIRQTDGTWQIYHWDDWYDYPGSHWRGQPRSGVDAGQPSRWLYAFHLLIGHHGIFSLTPLWVLLPLGWLACGFNRQPLDRATLWILLIAMATLVCIAFYVRRPMIDRNYGGVSCGFRWMFWFAPLWWATIAPVVGWLDRTKIGRFSWGILVMVSVAFAATALDNPWSHPWMYEWF